MNRAKTGQVWEGASGWIILVIKADEDDLGTDWLVHEVYTLVWPKGAPARDRRMTVSEYVPNGGMAHAGWTRLF